VAPRSPVPPACRCYSCRSQFRDLCWNDRWRTEAPVCPRTRCTCQACRRTRRAKENYDFPLDNRRNDWRDRQPARHFRWFRCRNPHCQDLGKSRHRRPDRIEHCPCDECAYHRGLPILPALIPSSDEEDGQPPERTGCPCVSCSRALTAPGMRDGLPRTAAKNNGPSSTTLRKPGSLTSGPICGTAPGAPHPVAPFDAGGPGASASRPPLRKTKNGSAILGSARKSAALPRSPKIRDLLRRKIAVHGGYGLLVLPETGEGLWRQFSTFTPEGFPFKGTSVRTAEHALRCAWLEAIGVPKPFVISMSQLPSAGAVRRQSEDLQNNHSDPAKWQLAKDRGRFVDVLMRVLQARLNASPRLQADLQATKGAYLVYASGDPQLGCQTQRLPGADDVERLRSLGLPGAFPGDNLVGKALMTIRETMFANGTHPLGWPDQATLDTFHRQAIVETTGDQPRVNPPDGPSGTDPTAPTSALLDPPPDEAVGTAALEELFGPAVPTGTLRADTPLQDETDPDDPPPLVIDDTDPEAAEVVNGLVKTVASLLLSPGR
jgi:predicted NAD-dependent protein-ADP-ribosyltransferase YbiA (DUF1768 family)